MSQSAVKYDCVCVVGTYKDANGEEKARFKQVGVVLQTQNGFVVKMDTIPVNFDGTIFLKTPKPKDNQQPRTPPPPPPTSNYGAPNDDLDF